jgi:hypothetical protein
MGDGKRLTEEKKRQQEKGQLAKGQRKTRQLRKDQQKGKGGIKKYRNIGLHDC